MREEEAEAEAIAGALEGGRHGIPAGATPDVEREGRRRFVRHRVGTPEEPRERGWGEVCVCIFFLFFEAEGEEAFFFVLHRNSISS